MKLPWSCLIRDQPLLVVAWFAIVAMFLTIGQVAISVSASRVVDRGAREVVLLLAAEEAAFAAVRDGVVPKGDLSLRAGAGFECRVRVLPGEYNTHLRVSVLGPGHVEAVFDCPLLLGSVPNAFKRSLCLARVDVPDALTVMPLPIQLSSPDFPRLDHEDLETCRADTAGTRGFVVDDSIALLHLSDGTDLTDYRFSMSSRGHAEPTFPASGVIRIDGHLWVDRGEEPLRLRLLRDLTIIVDGNFYLGRSLRVDGDGRLTVVARGGRGVREGVGSVWLGLPCKEVTADVVDLEASILADADLRVEAGLVIVRGGIVSLGGLSRGLGGRELRVTGERVFDIHRERMPGFEPCGSPRPGILRRVH